MELLYLWKPGWFKVWFFYSRPPTLNSLPTTWLPHANQESFDIRTILKMVVMTPPTDPIRVIKYNGLFCKSSSKCEHLPHGSQGTLFKINLPNSFDELREAINIVPNLLFKDYKDLYKAFYSLSPLHVHWDLGTVLSQWGCATETAVNTVSFHSSPGHSYGSSVAEQWELVGLLFHVRYCATCTSVHAWLPPLCNQNSYSSGKIWMRTSM